MYNTSQTTILLNSRETIIISLVGGLDLNQGPSGYEPDELPDCSTPR